jgi:hypothetical protein
MILREIRSNCSNLGNNLVGSAVSYIILNCGSSKFGDPSGGVLNDDGSFRQNAWVLGLRSAMTF